MAEPISHAHEYCIKYILNFIFRESSSEDKFTQTYLKEFHNLHNIQSALSDFNQTHMAHCSSGKALSCQHW